jgi:hypothetical protein
MGGYQINVLRYYVVRGGIQKFRTGAAIYTAVVAQSTGRW